jgi:hypothetical protein
MALNMIAHFALVTHVDKEDLGVIPGMITLFAICRGLFFKLY